MNCRQAQDFLPLYAGRDLDENRAGLVAEHLQSCAACAQIADDYREAFQLTQQLAPPVFAEGVYAGIRQRVLRQIEAEAAAPALPQMFAGFRPRMAWAFASALIIVLGVFALYLVVNRSADVPKVADNHPTVNSPEQNPQSTVVKTPTPQTVNPGAPRKVVVEKRRGLLNRPSFVAAGDPRSASRTGISPKLRESEAANSLPPEDGVPGKSPLRVEIQTKNPNIRIIWFSQSNSKPASPNSKGI